VRGLITVMGRAKTWRGAIVCALALVCVGGARAGTLHGSVVNRTTGKPAGNVAIVLIQLQGGMTPVGNTTSDAQGNFTLTNDAIGAGPMLIRATYSGVTFNTPLPPGRGDSPTIEVYDVSHDAKTIRVESHLVIFQPRGETLLGAEEYIVKNDSQPPVAYYRTDGSFEFGIPENAKLQQVATTSSTGMPVTQAPIEKGAGTNAIAYAFRPGETAVRLSYEMPYTAGSATVKIPASYAGMRLLLVAPPGVSLRADGLQSGGMEQGMMVYSHEALAAKAALEVTVSGQASQAADAGGGGGGGGAGGAGGGQNGGGGDPAMPAAQEGNSRAGADIQAVPGRLEPFKWWLLAGMIGLFAMSGFLLSRKQVVVAGAAAEALAVTAGPERVAEVVAPVAAVRAGENVAVKSVGGGNGTVAAVTAQVASSLESLKDSIFRLELRRQAGTISEEDYALEREAMEKLLRGLVRG